MWNVRHIEHHTKCMDHENNDSYRISPGRRFVSHSVAVRFERRRGRDTEFV